MVPNPVAISGATGPTEPRRYGQLMTYPRPLDLSDQEIVALPVDRLGFEILRAFHSGTQVHTYNFLNAWRNASVDENGALMHALAEACDWLRQRGLTVEPPGISNGFITRLGQRALEAGLPYVGAITKLSENL